MSIHETQYAHSPCDSVAIEKPPPFLVEVSCLRYLSSRVDQVLSCRPQVSGGHLQAEKSLHISVEAGVRITYLPG